ncbi:MAG: universal stress protein [Deltaproteobacteria bacterium]|nr:MAG: universal stress protein [Deltaproteobacteria bacterium]
MKISKMLFVSEFEELWLDALQSLMGLRKAGLNHVVFLHVIHREKVAMKRGTGYLKQEERKLREIADIRFIDWAETLFEEGMEVGAHIVIGNTVPKILSVTEDEGVDLIVTARRKRGKLEELYAGSETSDLLRRTVKPVLIYNYLSQSGKVGENPFERLLLGLDWSVSSERVLDYVLALKGAVKRVDIIHVLSEKAIGKLSKKEAQKLEREHKKRLNEVCDVLTQERFDARPHLYIGNTEEQIEKGASEHRVTMIVLGTRSKSVWKERWSGSVSHALAERSELPILVVPAETK